MTVLRADGWDIGSPRPAYGVIWAGLDLPCDGLATASSHVVLDQVSAALGGQADLRGLIAGRGLGQLTLRVRCCGTANWPSGWPPVRIAPGDSVIISASWLTCRPVSDRTQNAFAFPDVVASGAADGISWAAERWLKSPAVRASRAWRPSGEGWGALRAIAAELAAGARTGCTGAGWARGWVTGLDAVAPGLVEEILVALAPIEAGGMATAWCHGDLWPGNVFLRRPRGRPWSSTGNEPGPMPLRAWTRCTPKCVASSCADDALRRSGGPAGSIRLPRAGRHRGRREAFADWERPQQQALLLATVTHYATGENESGPTDRWTESWGEMNILPIMTALRAVRA